MKINDLRIFPAKRRKIEERKKCNFKNKRRKVERDNDKDKEDT